MGFATKLVNRITCTLQVNTYTSATTSTTLWYEKVVTIDVDGGPSNDKFSKYETFIYGG